MNKEKMDKLLEMIKGDLAGVSVSKKVENVFTSINFRYNKEKDVITYNISVGTRDKVQESNGIIGSEEEITRLVEEFCLQTELVGLVDRRIAKESKMAVVREDMLTRVEAMGLDDKQKAVILSVIDRTTQLSDVVGMGNRVGLATAPDFFEHVRVTGPNKWSDDGDVFHLQLIQAVEEPTGRRHHNYPAMSFEELIGRILNSPLIIEEQSKGKGI